MTLQVNVDELNRLLELSPQKKQEIPIADINQLWKAIHGEFQRAQEAKRALQDLMRLKFKEKSDQLYGKKGEWEGSGDGDVNWKQDGYTICSSITRKLKWDQAKLKSAYKKLKADGHNPEEFIDVTLSVTKTNYKLMGESLRKQLEEAKGFAVPYHVYKFK